MKKQILNLLTASVLLVLALTLVSATITLNVPSITKTTSSFDFTVTSNTNTSEGEGVNLSINNNNFNLSSSSFNLNNVTPSKTISVTYNASKFDFDDFLTTYSYTLTATNSTGSKTTASVVFSDKTYCLNGDQGKIKIEVEDKRLDNSNKWEWRPYNEIELSVNVENNDKEDMSGTIEYCLWDSNDEKCVFDGDMDFSVDSSEDEDYKIVFTIDPSDLDFSVEDYTLYVKAYDDDEWSESTQCNSFSESVKINTNKNEVIINEDKIVLPETINAGDTVTIEVPVYNIGSEDQDDVLVKFYSKPLGVATMEQTISSLDSGDEAKVYFTFAIPSNASSGKSYEAIFTLYDEDEDVYEYEDSDGDKVDAIFSKNLVVVGSSTPTVTAKATVSAELATSAKAGEEVVVKSVVTNTGKTTSTFSVSAVGYTVWADSVKASDTLVMLKAGESKEVTFTFNAKKDAEGTNKFNVEVLAGDNVVVSQPVSVEIEKAFSFVNLFQFGENWYLWAIGAFNVILVVVIIIVVVRLLKK